MPLERPVAELLSEPHRTWTPEPPASEGQIAELRTLVRFELPEEYLELLRFCNGGQGELDAPPLLFMMDSIAEAIEDNAYWHSQGEFVGFWFFGGNGGLERIAFDLRSGPPYPIVMIDRIAGDDSAEQIADSMADFIPKIGIEADQPQE